MSLKCYSKDGGFDPPHHCVFWCLVRGSKIDQILNKRVYGSEFITPMTSSRVGSVFSVNNSLVTTMHYTQDQLSLQEKGFYIAKG
jgi:hypothetical protein